MGNIFHSAPVLGFYSLLPFIFNKRKSWLSHLTFCFSCFLFGFPEVTETHRAQNCVEGQQRSQWWGLESGLRKWWFAVFLTWFLPPYLGQKSPWGLWGDMNNWLPFPYCIEPQKFPSQNKSTHLNHSR